MTNEQIEVELDAILENYPGVVDRKDIAKICGISYHQVPKFIKDNDVPTLDGKTDSDWKRIRVHKGILKLALIETYSHKK